MSGFSQYSIVRVIYVNDICCKCLMVSVSVLDFSLEETGFGCGFNFLPKFQGIDRPNRQKKTSKIIRSKHPKSPGHCLSIHSLFQLISDSLFFALQKL
jgi:hypothetical protein